MYTELGHYITAVVLNRDHPETNLLGNLGIRKPPPHQGQHFLFSI